MSKDDMRLITKDINHLKEIVDNGFAQIKNSIEGMNTTLKKHNGRLSTLEKWKERIIGGGIATKFIWSVVVVLVLSGIYGLIDMSKQLNSIAQTVGSLQINQSKEIQYAVQKEVSSYFEKQ